MNACLIIATQPSVLWRVLVLRVNDLWMTSWLREGCALIMMRPLLPVKSQDRGDPWQSTMRSG